MGGGGRSGVRVTNAKKLKCFVFCLFIYILTVTLLNNSVELSSNLDPEPLKRVD